MSSANIFTHYAQLENHFTNGLLSILALSQFECLTLVPSFLRDELGLDQAGEIGTFRVLRDVPGTVDAQLCGRDCCIVLETKIRSGTLDAVQIQRHLEGDGHGTGLKDQLQRVRRLVLLTPDDRASRYIQHYLSIDEELIIHLEWKRAYRFLEPFARAETPDVFSELVRQYLAQVHHTIFTQDFAGIILKVDFGDKSGVYSGDYLSEMKAGKWTRWNTPREYKMLDGKGRKLMLYDKTRKAITVEVEIARVTRTDPEADYPWTNEFAMDTLQVFDESPIELRHIEAVEELKNFRYGRSAVRNITHEQYRKLKEKSV